MRKWLVILEDSSKVTYGGGQKGTLEIIEALKDNFDIFLFDCTKNSIFQEKLNNIKITKKYLKCYGKIVRGNKSSFSVGYLEVLLFPIFMIYNLFILMKFILSNTHHKMIFYTSNKKHLIILYFLKKILNIDYVFHARTYDDKSSFFYKILIFPLKNAKKIICVSNFIKEHINYSNCIVIYNPLFIPKKYETFHHYKIIDNKEIVVATLSELLKWKGIDYFINSFKFLKIDIPNIKFFIYGKGNQEKNLKYLAKDKNDIIFKGYHRNIFKEMINDINIIVSSSISPESFGRTTIEGCYFGIVPVSSNLGAQKELITKIDNNLLFESKNSKDMARAIKYAIDNYEVLSKKCIKFSENFDFKIFKKEIIRIFNKL